MTHTITIETQNDSDFALFKGLAQRIGIPFSEKHTGTETVAQQEALKKFFGSWGEKNPGMSWSTDNAPPHNRFAPTTCPVSVR